MMFQPCEGCDPASSSKRKHTCWRRQSDSESEEDIPPAKRQVTVASLAKRAGGAHDGGQQFERKVAAVLGLRSLYRGDDFHIATNVDAAGNFDDVVYTVNKNRYFIQVKHTDNDDTTKIVHSDLVPLLHQCFESYCDIIKGSHFKDITLQNSKFVIYTNKTLGSKLKKHDRSIVAVDSVFKTSDKGEIFNFAENRNNEADVYTRVEKLLTSSKNFNGLSVSEQDIKLDMLKDFLENLIMITGQKGQSHLDKVIIEEMRKNDAIKAKPKAYSVIFRHFKIKLESWWRDRKEDMTKHLLEDWIEAAKTELSSSLVNNLYKGLRKKLIDLGVRFSNRTISWLRSELSKESLIQIRTNSEQFCNVLLADSLIISECIFTSFESIVNLKNDILHAWVGGKWTWLVIYCDCETRSSSIVNLCLNIIGHTKLYKPKYVVVLTDASTPKLKDFHVVDSDLQFEQLDSESRELILGKSVEFQGCKVSMEDLLQRHGMPKNILSPQLVIDLLTKESIVKIGKELPQNDELYVPRVFERRIYLSFDVLNNSSDTFVVSSATGRDEPFPTTFDKFSWRMVDGNRMMEQIFDGEEIGRYIRISSDDTNLCFIKLSKILQIETLHWVEYEKGKFLWRRSHGETTGLWDYIDVESTLADKNFVIDYMKTSGNCGINVNTVWDINEKKLLLIAPPGMGKTTTITHLSHMTKKSDPTSWLLRLNWNDHTTKLSKINTSACDLETVIEFIISTLFSKSNYRDFTTHLIKIALEKTGNVAVLLDGYDEISPLHADKAGAVLSVLTATEAARVWITSRPVVREKLEEGLSLNSYTMTPLSYIDQRNILTSLWKSKVSGNEEKEEFLQSFILDIITKTQESLDDKYFTGFPLCIFMIATIFEERLETTIESGEVDVPEQMDINDMYDKFTERKLQIYLRDKKNEDVTNACVDDDQEEMREMFVESHEKAALVALLPTNLLNSLHDKSIEGQVKKFMRKVKAGKEKRGVIFQVIEERPHFVHRTFSEYFTARWFSKNFQDNRSLMEVILFNKFYTVVRNVFDRILATGHKLHTSILTWELGKVRKALEVCDVNEVDDGGRTAFHMAVAQGEVDGVTEIVLLLLERNARTDIVDDVLRWTVMRYADYSGSWGAMDMLLEQEVDDCELVLTRSKCSDPEYICPVVECAMLSDYSFLLKFLHKIGVDLSMKVSKSGSTPLHIATVNKNIPKMLWLLEIGVELDVRDNNDWTPMFYAASYGSLDTVKILLNAGASLEIRDRMNMTPLDWALESAQGDIAQSLGTTNNEGTEIVQYLRDNMTTETSTTGSKDEKESNS